MIIMALILRVLILTIPTVRDSHFSHIFTMLNDCQAAALSRWWMETLDVIECLHPNLPVVNRLLSGVLVLCNFLLPWPFRRMWALLTKIRLQMVWDECEFTDLNLILPLRTCRFYSRFLFNKSGWRPVFLQCIGKCPNRMRMCITIN